MALDPNEVVSSGTWDDPTDFPSTLPAGVDKSKEFYAQYTIYKDGRRVIQWYKRGTGDGKTDPVLTTSSDTATKVKTDWDTAQAKEEPAKEGDIRSSTGPTREAYHGGKWVVETNPVYQAPVGQNPNTPQNQNEAELQRQRQANAALPKDQDPAYETDEDRRKRGQDTITRQGAAAAAAETKARQDRLDAQAAADKNKPGAPTLKPDGKGGTIAVQTMPDGSIKTTPLPNVPSDKPTPAHIAVNGVTYERGPDGVYAPAAGLPSEGAATASDQRMPDWVHLGASEGLRQGWDMLQKDPTKTPEIRKSIFQEMVQAANIFQNQANTEERERESNRNASSNEAKYKLDFMQTGMQQALSFAQEVIKGGSGSAAGGKMFGVLMGMQLLQMKMSGINDLAPGQKPKPLPVVTPADLRDPAKLDAKAAEVQTHLETAQATTDTTHQTIDNLLNRPATPAAPAAPVSQGPAVATPAPAGLTTPQLGQGQDLSAPAGNPIGAPSSELGQPGDPGYGSTYRTPGDAASPPPGYPEPGMVSLPQPDSAPMMQPGPHPYAQPEPSQYSGGSDVQMAPPTSDWSALANVMPQQPAAQPQTAPDNGQPPTAMLAAKIKSTPPWRLDTSEIQQALAMGIPMEEIMSIPGRVA